MAHTTCLTAESFNTSAMTSKLMPQLKCLPHLNYRQHLLNTSTNSSPVAWLTKIAQIRTGTCVLAYFGTVPKMDRHTQMDRLATIGLQMKKICAQRALCLPKRTRIMRTPNSHTTLSTSVWAPTDPLAMPSFLQPLSLRSLLAS